MVQAALVRRMRAQHLLGRGCLLDLGSERCWALVITTVVALGIATVTMVVALYITTITIVIALGIATITNMASTITAFSLRLCA